MKINPYGKTLNVAGPQVRAWRTKRDLSHEQCSAKRDLMGFGIGQ